MIGYDGGTDFYARRNLPISFPLLDIHATGLAFRVGAAVTAIAAALPSQNQENFPQSRKGRKTPFNLNSCLCAFAPLRENY